MKDEVAPACVCLQPNDPEELSLSHTVFLLTFMLFIFVVLWTTRLPISCTARPPRVLSQSCSFIHRLFYTSVFSVALPKKTCLTSIILGNRAKLAVRICKEILFRTSDSQAGCAGFSLPHLTAQRFKWYELLGFFFSFFFCNKTTF